jgi:putative nucleotidyltransferase with HDIG domain
MSSRIVQAYVAIMCVAALAALYVTDWGSLALLNTGGLWGLAALVGMGLLSESLAIRLKLGSDAGNASITFIPLLASVQLFGPAAAVVLMFVTGTVGEFLVRGKALIRGVFNVAQWTLATFAAGTVFGLFGGIPLESTTGAAVGVELWGQILPFGLFAVVFLLVNHAAVSLVIALSQGLRFSAVMAQMVGHSGASLPDLLISPIAIAVAFLYLQVGITGILVVFLPVVFIRHSYLTTSRLREANADLLKALVKAIETRDPYTSGHSLRVSYLARRISESLGLPRAVVEKVEQAALLHDIGKIDSVYTAILSKPDVLSGEERAVIQSHVTKGEELLRNLSSFPEEVILAVRHHHERLDGAGYPDGLAGEQIPVGAMVIGVCDAVDAMLSDRPYRAALSIPSVLQQLRDHSGSQFAPAIVDAILRSDLIAEYAEIVRASKNAVAADPSFGMRSGAPLPPTPRFAVPPRTSRRSRVGRAAG